MRRLRIATRGSDLALWQARFVAARIERELDRETEIVPIKTTGDRLRGSLARVGGKGLFVKEIEEALLDGRADLAVHSAKDLPAVLRPDLPLVAIPERADPRDVLAGRVRGVRLEALPSGARVGTGSVRRGAQLRRRRPDLVVVPLRGNVPTRLARLEGGDLEAVVLAGAGLERLGLTDRIDERLAAEVMLPAVAQGALAIQARRDVELAGALRALDEPESATRVAAERAFLAHLGGDCNVPIAALAEVEAGAQLRLRALVISPDGRRVAEAEVRAPLEDAPRAGREAAETVLGRGGAAILAQARSDPGA